MEQAVTEKISALIDYYRKKDLTDREIEFLIRGIFLNCPEHELDIVLQDKVNVDKKEIIEQVEINLYPDEAAEELVQIELPVYLLEELPKERWQEYIINLLKEHRGL